METTENIFKRLLQIDVSKHVEKKGQFAYLSWPFAVSQLRLMDPSATWTVQRFNGLPYLQAELGCFVEVSVTVQGITLSQIHPVLDSRNKPINKPSDFDINTSIQRCLVKAIALHGLGLNVYAGEDLPVDQEEPPIVGAKVTSIPTRETQPVSDAFITKEEIKTIQALIKETGTQTEALLKHFKLSTLESIPSSHVGTIMKALEAKKQKAA